MVAEPVAAADRGRPVVAADPRGAGTPEPPALTAEQAAPREPPMTHPDRVKLLFGPYRTPPLKRGDRAFCLFRDCAVVVTSWTDARIPWPRCRPLDSPLGGSGLLVDEVLARAIRHESAAAICFWWRASEGA